MLPQSTIDRLLAFRATRDWEQFHDPKNLAIALAVEATELLEIFQWSRETDLPGLVARRRPAIRAEVADIAILLTYLCHDLGLDLNACVADKLTLNEENYPLATSKGTARKYNDHT